MLVIQKKSLSLSLSSLFSQSFSLFSLSASQIIIISSRMPKGRTLDDNDGVIAVIGVLLPEDIVSPGQCRPFFLLSVQVLALFNVVLDAMHVYHRCILSVFLSVTLATRSAFKGLLDFCSFLRSIFFSPFFSLWIFIDRLFNLDYEKHKNKK